MKIKLFTRRKFLIAYSAIVTIALVSTMLMGAAQIVHKARFDEIDVQRVNIVEPDGTLRMIIANTSRAPGMIIKGKEYPHPDRKTAGMVFYNDEGTENGGLIFDGRKTGDGSSSHGHLSFDNYEQDQVMVIEGNQDGGRKSAFIAAFDRPEYSLEDIFSYLAKHGELTEQQRNAYIRQYLNERPAPHQRIYLGRREDHSVDLSLKDADGHDRLVMKVAADGTPTLQLLDADGKVAAQLPAAKN